MSGFPPRPQWSNSAFASKLDVVLILGIGGSSITAKPRCPNAFLANKSRDYSGHFDLNMHNYSGVVCFDTRHAVGRDVMETVTMVAFGVVLAIGMFGLSALLFRKPHHG